MKGSLHTFTVDAIHVPERLRALRDDRIDLLVKSVREIGLQTPITVRIAEAVDDETGEIEGDVPVLITGRHRLEAVRRLAAEGTLPDSIPCLVVEDDADHCRLWEIDENLARAELTPTEEGEHLVERERVWKNIKKAENQVAQSEPPEIGYRKPPPQSKKFAAETAEATGRSKATINRALHRAKAVEDEARSLIVGTPLDTGAFLDRLAKVPRDQQVDHVRRQLQVIVDKEARDRQAREQADREKEARSARKAALSDACELILDTFPPAKYDRLVRLLDDAGEHRITAALRALMPPSSEAA